MSQRAFEAGYRDTIYKAHGTLQTLYRIARINQNETAQLEIYVDEIGALYGGYTEPPAGAPVDELTYEHGRDLAETRLVEYVTAENHRFARAYPEDDVIAGRQVLLLLTKVVAAFLAKDDEPARGADDAAAQEHLYAARLTLYQVRDIIKEWATRRTKTEQQAAAFYLEVIENLHHGKFKLRFGGAQTTRYSLATGVETAIQEAKKAIMNAVRDCAQSLDSDDEVKAARYIAVSLTIKIDAMKRPPFYI